MDAKQFVFGIVWNKLCGAWTPISLYLKHFEPNGAFGAI